MCFSKEASIITTFLVYSAAIYSIVNKYHKSKYFLFVILGHILTVGIIEPLEGVIHALYEKEKSTSSKLFKNLETALWFSILLQPLFQCLLFIILKINPNYNKYVIGLNVLFYTYTMYVYDNIRLDIIPKNENGYTKMYFNKLSQNIYWARFEILTFLLPIILGVNKSIHMLVLLIQQIIIIFMASFIGKKIDHSVGSLWCFFSSVGLWLQIIVKNFLQI